jgi:thiamine-phosphate pyrophosphorylase
MPPSRHPIAQARLYLLATPAVSRLPLPDAVEAALRGGVDVVQLREKDLPEGQVGALARRLLAQCRRHGAVFLVNDSPAVAQQVGADGVHLGQDDAPVSAARRVLGPAALVGVSAHDDRELERALADGADYVGLGSAFPSRTKTRGLRVAGPAALGALARRSEAAGVPAFAIGGVTPDNAGQLVAAGFRRVAVCAGVLAGDDPERAARRLRAALEATPPRRPA